MAAIAAPVRTLHVTHQKTAFFAKLLLLPRALRARPGPRGSSGRPDVALVPPATERLVCLAGAPRDGFEAASAMAPPERAFLRVAETTVRRTTKATGRRVADHLRAGGAFAFPRPWDWHNDARGARAHYIGVDLTGVRR